MKFHADVIKELFLEDYSDAYEVIEEGDWVSDGKYQHCDLIFKFEDKFYSVSMYRSGSYHTDWYYEWEDTKEFECPEVEKVEVVRYEWKVKK